MTCDFAGVQTKIEMIKYFKLFNTYLMMFILQVIFNIFIIKSGPHNIIIVMNNG